MTKREQSLSYCNLPARLNFARQGLLPATHTTSCYLPFLNKQGDCEVSGYSNRKTQRRLHTSLTHNWLVTQGQ